MFHLVWLNGWLAEPFLTKNMSYPKVLKVGHWLSEDDPSWLIYGVESRLAHDHPSHLTWSKELRCGVTVQDLFHQCSNQRQLPYTHLLYMRSIFVSGLKSPYNQHVGWMVWTLMGLFQAPVIIHVQDVTPSSWSHAPYLEVEIIWYSWNT